MNDFEKEFMTGTVALAHFWINEYKEYASEIMTQWGLCFTYNIAFSHDLLHVNVTSDDFHYEHANKAALTNPKMYEYETAPKEMPQSLSTSKAGLWVGFDLGNADKSKLARNTLEGYTIILHDAYELPSANSQILNLNLRFQTSILINPSINSIDETLHGYEPAELVCIISN